MKFKDVNQAIDLIENRHDWTKQKVLLNRFNEYIEFKNNPQYALKCIHISGTNGKGSTCKALQMMLTQAGYKVGTFNSPSMISHMDAIRIDGQFISEEEYLHYVNLYFDEWMEFDLSIFEVDTFISFMYFIDQKVDFVIYEVGMGGKDDATNVIHSILSCITNIGLDHCSFLGNTYEEIAQTKGEIIKENSLFITSEKREVCLNVFSEICRDKNTKRIEMENPYNISITDCLQFDTDSYKNIKVPTIAYYQAQNIALSLSILIALRNNGYIQYKDEDIYKSLKLFSWEGRFEIIQKNPLILLDGAHNKEGIDALVESCKYITDLHVVFSALKDKPYDYMLDRLSEVSGDITVCEFDFYRAQNAQDLSNNHKVTIIRDYREAINQKIKEKVPLLICGSLYFIRIVRDYLKGEGYGI